MKTTVYAATKSAKERIANGGYKKRCAKGCASCGVPVKKDFGSGKPEKDAPAEK